MTPTVTATAVLDAATWRKASFSGAGNDCVELAAPDSTILGVRDTKRRDAGTLVLPGAARLALLSFARRGGSEVS